MRSLTMAVSRRTVVPYINPGAPSAIFARLARTAMRKVLLIDDETEICFLLSNVLRRTGAHCAMAHSLAEGRRALSEQAYDAVFLDIHLPDGLGYDLIPEIRRLRPGTRVIAISAVDNERTTAADRGADLFIAKPLSKDLVLDGLRTLGLPA